MANPQTVKTLTSGTNALFMCYKCVDRVTKMKPNRRSTDQAANVRSSSGHVSNQNLQETSNSALAGIHEMLNRMNDKLTTISDREDELTRLITNTVIPRDAVGNDVSSIAQSITSLHAKIDHLSTTQRADETNNTTLIVEKLNRLSDSLQSPPEPSIARPNDLRRRVSGVKSKDPLDWSFTCNSSSHLEDNNEFFQMLSSFEKNTWTSFDFLRSRLSDNTDVLLNVESICKNLISGKSLSRIESPLTESIKMDTIQSICDKCDEINKKVTDIGIDLQSKLVNDKHPDGDLTQELTDRFLAIISHSDGQLPKPDDNHGDNDRRQVLPDQNRAMTTDSAIPEKASTGNLLLNESVALQNITTRKSPHRLGSNVRPPSCKVHFHLSPLDIQVTPNDIADYITENCHKSTNRTDIRIRPLLKKGQDVNSLSFITYKVETSHDIGEMISQPGFWPQYIRLKPWIQKSKSSSSSSFLDNRQT